MAYHNSATFDSLPVRAEFRIPFSSLTFVKKSKTSATVYNDYDEKVGIDYFKSSDHVEQQ